MVAKTLFLQTPSKNEQNQKTKNPKIMPRTVKLTNYGSEKTTPRPLRWTSIGHKPPDWCKLAKSSLRAPGVSFSAELVRNDLTRGAKTLSRRMDHINGVVLV